MLNETTLQQVQDAARQMQTVAKTNPPSPQRATLN
jgi:hypothetical protein